MFALGLALLILAWRAILSARILAGMTTNQISCTFVLAQFMLPRGRTVAAFSWTLMTTA